MPKTKTIVLGEPNSHPAKDPFGFWIWRKLLVYSKQFGIKETIGLLPKNASHLFRQYLNWRFDYRFHVDTSGVVQLAGLTCDSANKELGVWHEPTPIRTLGWMFSHLPPDVSDWTFVDFGSGKGRTILYASNYNFRRIIGVEFARELHAIAERNITTYRSRRRKCVGISSFCMDAVQFPIPDGNCLFYFFRPFREEVMERVIDNIYQSYRKSPRKLVVFYYHPEPDSAIEKQSFLRKREERPMPFDPSGEPCPYRRRLAIYET
jgi:hypothetical protein